jgi:hypothetical protein
MLEWAAIKTSDPLCPTLWLVDSKNESALPIVEKHKSAREGSRIQVHVMNGVDRLQEFTQADKVFPALQAFMLQHCRPKASRAQMEHLLNKCLPNDCLDEGWEFRFSIIRWALVPPQRGRVRNSLMSRTDPSAVAIQCISGKTSTQAGMIKNLFTSYPWGSCRWSGPMVLGKHAQ